MFQKKVKRLLASVPTRFCSFGFPLKRFLDVLPDLRTVMLLHNDLDQFLLSNDEIRSLTVLMSLLQICQENINDISSEKKVTSSYLIICLHDMMLKIRRFKVQESDELGRKIIAAAWESFRTRLSYKIGSVPSRLLEGSSQSPDASQMDYDGYLSETDDARRNDVFDDDNFELEFDPIEENEDIDDVDYEAAPRRSQRISQRNATRQQQQTRQQQPQQQQTRPQQSTAPANNATSSNTGTVNNEIEEEEEEGEEEEEEEDVDCEDETNKAFRPAARNQPATIPLQFSISFCLDPRFLQTTTRLVDKTVVYDFLRRSIPSAKIQIRSWKARNDQILDASRNDQDQRPTRRGRSWATQNEEGDDENDEFAVEGEANNRMVLDEDEIERFQKEVPTALHSDPLDWWRTHEQQYPLVSFFARQYLSIPATSTLSERAFSAAGNTFSKKRYAFKAETGSNIVFLNQNQYMAFPDLIKKPKDRALYRPLGDTIPLQL